MSVYSLKCIQKIPISVNEAWDFFSSPANLSKITPTDMGFVIKSHHHGNKMYAGQIIEYTVRPVLNIPVYWMTEITHVVDQQYFVDEQRFGPYSLWHHQHHFRPIEGGVEMTDIVHYKSPLGFLGNIANSLFVRSKLRSIFAFRVDEVNRLFGKWPGDEPVVQFD